MNAFAIALEQAGGQNPMAKALGVRQSTVWSWLHRGTPLPPEICPRIERAAAAGAQRRGDARAVRCEDLRPDVTWLRDGGGQVRGYVVRLGQAA